MFHESTSLGKARPKVGRRALGRHPIDNAHDVAHSRSLCEAVEFKASLARATEALLSGAANAGVALPRLKAQRLDPDVAAGQRPSSRLTRNESSKNGSTCFFQ